MFHSGEKVKPGSCSITGELLVIAIVNVFSIKAPVCAFFEPFSPFSAQLHGGYKLFQDNFRMGKLIFYPVPFSTPTLRIEMFPGWDWVPIPWTKNNSSWRHNSITYLSELLRLSSFPQCKTSYVLLMSITYYSSFFLLQTLSTSRPVIFLSVCENSIKLRYTTQPKLGNKLVSQGRTYNTKQV